MDMEAAGDDPAGVIPAGVVPAGDIPVTAGAVCQDRAVSEAVAARLIREYSLDNDDGHLTCTDASEEAAFECSLCLWNCSFHKDWLRM